MMRRVYRSFIAFGLLASWWSMDAAAAPSERLQNPACGPFACDEVTARAECEDELSIAKSDPGLQPWVQELICYNGHGRGSYNIVWQNSFQDANLNDYQNGFWYYDVGFPSNLGSPCCGEVNFGDPVNGGIGNKYEHKIEYLGQGGFPLELSWTYNSQYSPPYYPKKLKIFGRNRTHNYLRRVNYYPDASVPTAYVSRADGKAIRFVLSGSVWLTDRGGMGKLDMLTSGGTLVGWRFDDRNGGSELYDQNGRLTELHDVNGLKQSLNYDLSDKLISVIDSSGRALVFVYDSHDLVERVDLPDGTAIQFFYGASNDLERVEYADGKSVQYRYNETDYVESWTPGGSLTGVIDESLGRYSTTLYTKSPYSRNAKATGTYFGSGIGMVSATYGEMSAGENYATSFTVSLPDGASRQVNTAVANGQVVPASVTVSCAGCPTKTTTYGYDDNGLIDTVDVAGTVFDHDLNFRGLEVQRIDAANDVAGNKRTTQTDWHADFPVPIERRIYDAYDALKSKTVWTYNARGQALTVNLIDPVTGTTRTNAASYCEQADMTAGTCPLVGSIKTVNGQRTDVDDTFTYTYYSSDDASCALSTTSCSHRKGDLWKVTNSLGQVTETLKYDGAGRVLSVKDANGVVTDMEYHPRGWLTATKVRGTDSSTESDDRITRIDYWPTGLVKQVTQPDGAFTAYTYDAAHRLTDVSDNAGNTIHYTLDNAGNRIAEDTKDANGNLKRTLNRVYNQLGQLATQADAVGNPTDYGYDANGNTTSATDALSRVTQSEYDPLNRLKRTLQDVGGIAADTKFAYDALDNLTEVTDPKGLKTTYTYNGLGDLTKQVSPDTGTTLFTYDSAGNRITQKDARSKTTTYSYDALNRLTGIAYANTSFNVTYTYDANQSVCTAAESFPVGRLTKMQDGSGTTQYCYNRFGDLTRKVQTVNGVALTLRYSYAPGGQLTAMTYPDGAVVDYVRDSQGRITEVGVKPSSGARQVLLTGATYHPFGPAAGWTYGNGRQMTRTLDLDYRPAAIHDASTGGLAVGFNYDEVGNLVELTQPGSTLPQVGFGYDALGRLTQFKDGPTGTVIDGYGYDKTGNRTSLTTAAGTSTYSYPTTSHRLTNVGGIARTYDAAGNTTGINGTAKQFVYDDTGRMSSVKAGGTTTRNYKYNGKGERVRSYLSTANTYTLYDEAGHWIGDYGANGTPVQQAIWMDDLPVGLRTAAAGTVSYIEPDHLGSPRVVIDPVANTAIWKWDIKGEAFGVTAPEQDPDGNGTAFNLDMRFPGQRYDPSNGLNYNYFRDYESDIGRYVQSDPMGIMAGANTYAYVSSKPLTWYDPNGLQATQKPLPSPPRTPGPGFSPPNLPPANDPLYGPRTLPALGPLLRACATPQAALFVMLMALPNSTTACDTLDKPPECGGSDCSKASPWQLAAAGITDAHEFKDEFGAVPNSRYDICACKDGSIVIKAQGGCGSPGPSMSTYARWK